MTDTTWLTPWQITRLLDQLSEIPDLYASLDPTERPADTTGVHTPPGSRPPMRLDVVTLTDTRRKDLGEPGTPGSWDPDLVKRAGWRSGVLPTISQWVRLADGEMWDACFPHRDPATTPTVATETAWLAEHHQWLIRQQWADELADEIHRIHRDLQAALGMRPEYRPSCRQCGAKLDPMDSGSWYSCPACGRDYTIAGDLEALGKIQSATAKDCAIALGVRFETLRQWIVRHQIAHDGRDGKGRKLYDLDTIRRVVDQMARATG